MVCAYRNCTSRLIEARCFCLLSALCATVVPLAAAAALVGFCTDLPLAEVRLGLLLHTIKSFAIVYKDFFSFTLFILAQTLKRTVRLNYFPYISIQLYWSDFFINSIPYILLTPRNAMSILIFMFSEKLPGIV